MKQARGRPQQIENRRDTALSLGDSDIEFLKQAKEAFDLGSQSHVVRILIRAAEIRGFAFFYNTVVSKQQSNLEATKEVAA